MANISDAAVTITAEKVGEQLVNYINAINRSQPYYELIYAEPTPEMVDSEGNIRIDGDASGRWAYENNLRGYLDPSAAERWVKGEAHAAYLELCEAIEETGGRIEVDYSDCDAGTEWMGHGTATLEYADGSIVFDHDFTDDEFSVKSFAEMQGESELWALEYIHGEEVVDEYNKSEDKGGSIDDWVNNIYNH